MYKNNKKQNKQQPLNNIVFKDVQKKPDFKNVYMYYIYYQFLSTLP